MDNKSKLAFNDLVKKHYEGKCQRCQSEENLSVVIKSGNIKDGISKHVEDYMLLCSKCKSKLENQIKQIGEQFVGIEKVKNGMQLMLEGLYDQFGLDIEDENFRETPERVARAYYEMFNGINCQDEIKGILSTSFPATYKGMIIAKDIHCFSMCPHHFLPVEYYVNFGYIPNEDVLGISKLTRIVKLMAKQPALQESFTEDIVKLFKEVINPKGVIIQVRGRHFCMSARGVEQEDSWTLTSTIDGEFTKPDVKAEFQSLLNK